MSTRGATAAAVAALYTAAGRNYGDAERRLYHASLATVIDDELSHAVDSILRTVDLGARAPSPALVHEHVTAYRRSQPGPPALSADTGRPCTVDEHRAGLATARQAGDHMTDKPTTLLELLRDAGEDYDLFMAGAEETLRRLTEAAASPVGVRRYDAPGVTGGTTTDLVDRVTSDTSEAVGLSGRDLSANRARQDIDEVWAIARRRRHDDARLLRIQRAYAPRESTPLDRARAEGDNKPACKSCIRTFVRPNVKREVEVHKDGLCSWCYRWRGIHGALPPLKQLEAHHRGERVMVAVKPPTKASA